ncbi:hypothetical protein [Lacicoccus qingdaonensis]|uniref:Uncharacterized protein n=1 Tax=Lacicoccus qingdaonensis TaxID=576118 RepID=A0A1G9DBA8_9BACL|nr:hypothetical protein [Salinicoccus qingdaonensis]SDK61107.1 hypothetical protein SAMN05216216_105120 [Salinicoccus qingdaonensis]
MSKKTVKRIYVIGMIILLIAAVLNLVLEETLLNPFIIFGFMFILLAVNIYNNTRADGEDQPK